MANNNERDCFALLMVLPVAVIFIGAFTGSLLTFGIAFVIFAFLLGTC